MGQIWYLLLLLLPIVMACSRSRATHGACDRDFKSLGVDFTPTKFSFIRRILWPNDDLAQSPECSSATKTAALGSGRARREDQRAHLGPKPTCVSHQPAFHWFICHSLRLPKSRSQSSKIQTECHTTMDTSRSCALVPSERHPNLAALSLHVIPFLLGSPH